MDPYLRGYLCGVVFTLLGILLACMLSGQDGRGFWRRGKDEDETP